MQLMIKVSPTVVASTLMDISCKNTLNIYVRLILILRIESLLMSSPIKTQQFYMRLSESMKSHLIVDQLLGILRLT